MEDNRKFATFFADAPKGKKIGAVLSWIATVILLVALFVPGYQLRYQIKTEKGTFKDIPATMTSELKQMKEAAKLNFQFGAGTTSDKIDEFVEKGSTSVFSYLVSPDLQKARLVNLGTMSDAPDDISKICVALLVLFFVLVVAAAVASVFTISWCALAANLIGIIELLAVYFFVFAGKFSIDPTDTSITSRVAPALTMILIVLLVLAAIMSVASVIVSYVVHEDEEAFVDDWNSNDPSRDAETNLVDDGNATTVPATDNSMTVVASLIDLFISARKHKTTLIFPAAKKCRAGQDFSSACGENLLWLVANLKIRMRNIKDFVSPLKVRKLLLKGFIKRHTLNTFFGTDKGNFRPNLEMVLQFLETLLDNLIVRQARIHCNKPRFLGFPLFSFFSG